MKIIKIIIKCILILAFLPLGIVGIIMTIIDFDGVNLVLSVIGLGIGVPSLISFIRDSKTYYKLRSKSIADKKIIISIASNDFTCETQANNSQTVNTKTANNTSTTETRQNPDITHKKNIIVKSLDGDDPLLIPYDPVVNTVATNNANRVEVNKMPDQIFGIPLAYHYKNVDVCIIRDMKPDFNKLEQNLPVTFIPEPSNPYDPNAIIVRSGNIDIGYLYRGNLQQMMLDYLHMGYPVSSYITSVDGTNEKVNITIGFYNKNSGRNYDDFNKLVDKGAAYKSFKLTGNRNSDMQETLADCDENDEIEYEFDDEKGKYVAICGDEIGYFPKSANKYLEEEHPAFIESVEEDENDKYVVTVAVFYER